MKLKTLIAALAFVAIPAMVSAQTMKENEQTSEQLKHEIDILKADIKALKARQKSDKTNPEYIAQINAKNEELKEATRQKKLVDNVIKADKKAQKETRQAEKAMKQNDKAQIEADNLRQTYYYMDKSNEMLSDELKAKIEILNADIKALKARQKANKGDTDILAQLGQKKVELKEAKRQKAVFDKAIKADKKAKKETLQAEKAQERLDNATDKRQQ